MTPVERIAAVIMNRYAKIRILPLLMKIVLLVAAVITMLLAPCYVITYLASCHGAPWERPTALDGALVFDMSYMAVFIGPVFGWKVTYLMSRSSHGQWQFFRTYRQIILSLAWLVTISVHLTCFIMICTIYFVRSTTENPNCDIFEGFYRKIDTFVVVFLFMPGIVGAVNWLVYIGVFFRGCYEVKKQSYKTWALEGLHNHPDINYVTLIRSLQKLDEKNLLNGCMTYFRFIADPDLGENSSLTEAMSHLKTCSTCADQRPLVEFLEKQDRRHLWRVPTLLDSSVAAVRASFRPNVWDRTTRLEGPTWVKNKILLGCDIDEYFDVKERKHWCVTDW